MPIKLKRACESPNLYTPNLTEMLGNLQELKFAGPASVTNVSNASNVAHNKQVPININNTTYYLTLETAAR